jgi:hypothetical protein
MGEKAFPQIGEQPRSPFLVVPQHLGAPQREDAAQDERRHPGRMRLRIGQRQRAAPGAAEHQPALHAQQGAQPLDVGHQIPGRVVVQRSTGARAAAAALVKQQHAITLGVKQAAVLGRAARAGAAMQKHRRLALGVAAQLPVHRMAVAGFQNAGAKGLDGRVKDGLGKFRCGGAGGSGHEGQSVVRRL